MTEHYLRTKIAQNLAILNDGIENTWQDYLNDADSCIEIFKECISSLLAQKTDTNLRLSLGDLLGLKITFAPIRHDSQGTIRSQVPTGIPVRRRTIRRRSSASDRFYENRNSSSGLSFSPQQSIRQLPNRPSINSISKL